ncbi:hypothetical protein BJ165DRAFT_1508742 [Panaeolus papilionaceus]|nr:hypothetical protein BJ165DRAFT_1508742 [Panaeolus papilionaceus]
MLCGNFLYNLSRLQRTRSCSIFHLWPTLAPCELGNSKFTWLVYSYPRPYSLDKKVVLTLKDVLTRFAQAVQHMFTAAKYGLRALSVVRLLIDPPIDRRYRLGPRTVMYHLQNIAEAFLCAQSSATDAHNVYAELKREVEDQFRVALETYGTNSVIQLLTEKGKTTHSSLPNLRSTIVKHLGESEKSLSDLLCILAGINGLLRRFLEDEEFSLSEPVTTTPIFSPVIFQMWDSLNNRFNQMQVHLKVPMETYKTWFSWTAESEESALEADMKIRREKIVPPKIKIQVPKLSSRSTSILTLRPRDCRVGVNHVKQTRPGVTEVKVVVVVPTIGSWFHTKCFEIFCNIRPGKTTSPPINILNKSATLEDITSDPSFEPKCSRPSFKVIRYSASSISWVFWRRFPLCPWKSHPFPTRIAVTFDIKHQGRIQLDLQANIARRQKFPFNFLTITRSISENVLISPEGAYNF